MTQPDEDATQLSSRKRGEEDDATLLSSRQLRAADLGDDGTVLSSRARPPLVDGAEAPLDDDATRLSHRGGATGAPTRPQRRERSQLPPGAIGGAAARRGSFGAPAQEYGPREIPLPPAPPAAPVATPVPEDVGAPAPREMHRRREAARHRRLITTAVVFGVTAAVVTAAVIGIIALVRGS